MSFTEQMSNTERIMAAVQGEQLDVTGASSGPQSASEDSIESRSRHPERAASIGWEEKNDASACTTFSGLCICTT